MIDIASKLFPNVLTLITQLCASFVIYVMYKKYVHDHVIRFLDDKQQMMVDATEKAKAIDLEAQKQKELLNIERETMKRDMESYRLTLERKAKQEYDAQVKAASNEIARRNEASLQQINKEKEAMLQEVKEHAVDIAYMMSERALKEFEIDPTLSLDLIQRKLDNQ